MVSSIEVPLYADLIVIIFNSKYLIMKHLSTIILLFLLALNLRAQTFTVHPTFASALASIPIPNAGNGDPNEFNISDVNTITQLNINSHSITDLTGIKNFTYLEELECKSNNLTTVDLSGMASLKKVFFNSNQLQSMNVSGCVNLIILSVTNNNLTALDLNGITDLRYLYADNNNFSGTFDVNETLSYLTKLFVRYNNISQLNISNFQRLAYLQCDDNNLTSLDISSTNSTIFQIINFERNNISQINVSNQPLLRGLYGRWTTLDELDVSNNSNIVDLLVNHNAGNLTCIQVSQTQLNSIPSGWTKDAAASYSLSCNNCGPGTGYTCIPDVNFERFLDFTGNDDIYPDGRVPTVNLSSIFNLLPSNFGITDFTGIEDFVNLSLFYSINNPVINLDLSNNPTLSGVYIENTSLTSLDFSSNSNISSINLVNNSALSSIAFPNNADLTYLDLDNNQIQALDLSSLNSLDVFYWFLETNLTCIKLNSNQWANLSSKTLWTDYQNNSNVYNISCSGLKRSQSDLDFDYNSNTTAIYPNPFSNNLTLIGLYNMELLQIMNMNGREVLSEEISSVQMDLDMSELDNGIYILSLVSKDGTITREKIVKQ